MKKDELMDILQKNGIEPDGEYTESIITKYDFKIPTFVEDYEFSCFCNNKNFQTELVQNLQVEIDNSFSAAENLLIRNKQVSADEALMYVGEIKDRINTALAEITGQPIAVYDKNIAEAFEQNGFEITDFSQSKYNKSISLNMLYSTPLSKYGVKEINILGNNRKEFIENLTDNIYFNYSADDIGKEYLRDCDFDTSLSLSEITMFAEIDAQKYSNACQNILSFENSKTQYTKKITKENISREE